MSSCRIGGRARRFLEARARSRARRQARRTRARPRRACDASGVLALSRSRHGRMPACLPLLLRAPTAHACHRTPRLVLVASLASKAISLSLWTEVVPRISVSWRWTTKIDPRFSLYQQKTKKLFYPHQAPLQKKEKSSAAAESCGEASGPAAARGIERRAWTGPGATRQDQRLAVGSAGSPPFRRIVPSWRHPRRMHLPICGWCLPA